MMKIKEYKTELENTIKEKNELKNKLATICNG